MNRVWGRTKDLFGNVTWQQVTTDAAGLDDLVNIVWLQQVLKLNLGESPFFADWGIPAHVTVVTQVYPSYYVNLTQQRFARLFASLVVSRQTGVPAPPRAAPPPTYRVNITTHRGAVLPPITVPTSIPG